MQYYSTNNHTIKADFRKATLQGQPTDKGLYFPERIPQLSKDFIQNIKQLSREEIGYQVIKPYIGNSIDEASLKQIIASFQIMRRNIIDIAGSNKLLDGQTRNMRQ